MINLLNLTLEEFKKKLPEIGAEPYRAGQIFRWVFEKGVYDFNRMSNLSVELRKKLREKFSVEMPVEVERQVSKEDKSVKLLLEFADGSLVEIVTMSIKDRQTVCVSAQAGCKFHCAFCASGQKGFLRNLTAGEMIAQVLLARDRLPGKKMTHIVFMGVGEPFDNYKDLIKTIRMLNSPEALGIGARKITISTCGIIPKIQALVDEKLQVELSVSLHGATDAVRGTLLPINRLYPVKALVEVCRKYAKRTKRAVTFEYVLIQGVNASEKDARDMIKLLTGILCKVNIIPYNTIEEFPHEAPPYAEIVRFQQILQKGGLKTTVRFSKGRDIRGACGQLRAKGVKR